MRGLSAVLFCIALAIATAACGQDKGKAATGKKATTLAQSNEPAQKKAATKAHKKAPTKTEKKAPTQAQKKQDHTGDCNKQANLKNMKGEDRRRFMNTCLG